THRDPAIAIPSACSVIRTAQDNAVPSCRRHSAELGAFVLDHFVEGMRLATIGRAALGEDRFCDVYQQDFEQRPVETVERIYDFAGLALSGEVRLAMTQWSVDNRRGARGQHPYTPEEFGLTADGIREAFRDYLARFSP